MLRRRLRGILRTTLATGIPWTALGLLVGLVFRLDLIPDFHVELGRPIFGGLVGAFMLTGAIVGVVNGLSFSGLILATERGKKIEELRAWRFATWGALATAGTLGFVFQSAVGVGIGAVLGGVAGIAALAAARRATGVASGGEGDVAIRG